MFCIYAFYVIECRMTYVIQIPSQLPSHLRALRKTKGLTQAELATRVGVDQTRIAKIERDPLSVSVKQFLQILSALGVQIALQPMPTSHGSASITAPMGKLFATGTSTPPANANDGEDW